LEDIQPSTRRYPAIIFKPSREAGKQVLSVTKLGAKQGGDVLFRNITFEVNKGDKIAIMSRNPLAITRFFDILAGKFEPDEGSYKWGVTITWSYLPSDASEYFDTDLNLIDWLRQYSTNKEEAYVRGFLGKMLFSGEESLKKGDVLSGGEKVRCMISRMMLQEPNVLLLNEPTNHLDLETITAFNNSLIDYQGMIIMHSQDHEFMQTVSNRIIELTPNGVIDKLIAFDDYITSEEIKAQRDEMYMQPA